MEDKGANSAIVITIVAIIVVAGIGTYFLVKHAEAVTLYTPTGTTENSTVLTWSQRNATDFKNYAIYQSMSSGALGNQIATITDAATVSLAVTGLSPGTTYYFTVRVNLAGGAYEDSNQVSVTPLWTNPAFEALSKKIGVNDAVVVATLFTRLGFVLTEEFVDNFITDYYPGYDSDKDITIIGDPEAPYFLAITKASLNRLLDKSPEIYQYAIGALRYIRGVNFGTRCGAATAEIGGPGMAVNTYIYIYDYKDVPLDKQPPVYGFLFVHEATHIKINELERSGQIRELTGIEEEIIAYLAHGYYAKEYDPIGQEVFVYENISIKEFVKRWTMDYVGVPENYVWDWDFYINVLKKAGFPSGDLAKLESYLSSTN